jgi:hypothetical protein
MLAGTADVVLNQQTSAGDFCTTWNALRELLYAAGHIKKQQLKQQVCRLLLVAARRLQPLAVISTFG